MSDDQVTLAMLGLVGSLITGALIWYLRASYAASVEREKRREEAITAISTKAVDAHSANAGALTSLSGAISAQSASFERLHQGQAALTATVQEVVDRLDDLTPPARPQPQPSTFRPPRPGTKE